MKNINYIIEVSIVMPTYNDMKFISFAIDSVLNQTYTNWELIVINDASSDNTNKILKEYMINDQRIKCFTNSKNMSLVPSLNKGIALSKGKFIARLDSDDIWLDKTKLSKQITYLNNHPNVALIGTWGYRINDQGSLIRELKYPVTDKEIRKYMLIENCFLHSSVVFRKESFNGKKIYNNNYMSAEDYELWLRMGQVGELHILPNFMTGYRINKNGISSKRYNEQINNTIKAINKHKQSYSNYYIALPMWYARKWISRGIREKISYVGRKAIVK